MGLNQPLEMALWRLLRLDITHFQQFLLNITLLTILQFKGPGATPTFDDFTPFLVIKGSTWRINTVNFLHQRAPMMNTSGTVLLLEKRFLR